MFFNSSTRVRDLRPLRAQRAHSFSRHGVDISAATDIPSAQRLAGLDFQVGRKKLYHFEGGKPVEMGTSYGVFRLTEGGGPAVEFGSCGTEFTPVQNATAFEVGGILAGKGATFDRAGSEGHGMRNWIRMRVQDKQILGEVVNGFVLLRNSHVPGESFSARAWEERLVCTNGMTALQPGAMLLNLRHTGQVARPQLIARAEQIMLSVQHRLEELQILAERAARVQLTEERWEGLVHTLLPYPEGASDRQRRTVDEQRSVLYRSINAPDLANHVTNRNGMTVLNGWAALGAVSDFTSHLNDAQRAVKSDRATARLSELAIKDPILEQARDLILALN